MAAAAATATLVSATATPRSLADALVAAINARDAAAVGTLFHAEADCVTSFGAHLHGRAAIEAGHAAVFEGPMLGVHITVTSVEESALSDTVSLLMVRTTRTRKHDAPADAKLEFQRTIGTMTTKKESDGWWTIMALSNVGLRE